MSDIHLANISKKIVSTDFPSFATKLNQKRFTNPKRFTNSYQCLLVEGDLAKCEDIKKELTKKISGQMEINTAEFDKNYSLEITIERAFNDLNNIYYDDRFWVFVELQIQRTNFLE